MAVRKKLIEVSIPLEAINAASSREKSIRHGHPSTLHLWWARRPLAACRAVLFAQLVDDPSAWPERYPTKQAVEEERRRLHKVIERLVPWEASNDDAILTEARWEIARSVAWNLGEEPPPRHNGKAILDYLQTKGPPVYDPFSGGGSIPLEAQRLGLRAYGSDINPVAVLIGKALIEIPPKFAGKPPVNPKSRNEPTLLARTWKGAQGLADDVRYYGQWMRDEAEKRIGHLYPKAKLPDGTEATVIAWIWARTVRSPDPAAKSAMVPLISSFMLSSRDSKKVWVEPVLDTSAPDGYRFEIMSGLLSKSEEDRLKKGTIGRSGGGRCIISGAAMPFSYIRQEGQSKGLGTRLIAIVAEGQRERIFLNADEQHIATEKLAAPLWRPDGELPNNPRDFKTPNYGMSTFSSLFTNRQLVGLTTLSSLISEVRQKVQNDVRDVMPFEMQPKPSNDGEVSHADAIATYLAFAVDRVVDRHSSIATWDSSPSKLQLRNTFARQAIPMTWDFGEGNPFCMSSGTFSPSIEWVATSLERLPAIGIGNIYNMSATASSLPIQQIVISTDPPYYDNIGYADLSDYFYVWLRSSLSKIWPDLFRRLTTPKDGELVATPYRHGTKDIAEEYFMKGMVKALSTMRMSARDEEPLAIYYAFKQADADVDGITSAGWASFLQAVADAGLGIDGTWPLRTEMSNRMIGQGANALASSIVLVCRKRPDDVATATRAEFLRALKRELPPAIDDLRKAGISPVDMPQSVIGPGMGVFSRFSKVMEDDDNTMPVRTVLALINRVWQEIDSEIEANLDAETQVALSWYATYGFEQQPSGELIKLATPKDIALDTLFASGVFLDGRGKTGLVPREMLPTNWTPATDRTLTVWECVQHTARVLLAEDGGQDAAARLVGEMSGPQAEAARALAYRLFEIATQKGWNQEALVYNELAQEWTRLEDVARTLPERDASAANAVAQGPAQGSLF